MKQLILVCGPAAIGKSTWSNQYRAEHPTENVTILSADEVRKAICGGYDKFPKDKNMMVIYYEMIDRATKIARENKDVTIIFDTTMLYDERRLFFRRHLPQFHRYKLVLLKLHDYRECLVRNKKRIPEKWVPENIIMDMASHYVDPSPECAMHFDEIEEVYVD